MSLPTPNWITVTNGGKLPIPQQPFWIKRSCHPEINLYKGVPDPQALFSTFISAIAWLPADKEPYCIPAYKVDEAEESWLEYFNGTHTHCVDKLSYMVGYNRRKVEKKHI